MRRLGIIKHLGTNGGGFLGANSSTPIGNPTIISDLIELYSMMLLPGACVITFGKMVRDRKRMQAAEKAGEKGLTVVKTEKVRKGLTVRMYGREGRSIFLAMGIIFPDRLKRLLLGGKSEIRLSGCGLVSVYGKHGRQGSSFWNRTVRYVHDDNDILYDKLLLCLCDTLTPLGGMIPMLHMMLNVVFSGKRRQSDEYDYVCHLSSVYLRV